MLEIKLQPCHSDVQDRDCTVVLHVEYVKALLCISSSPRFGSEGPIPHAGPRGTTPVVSKPLASVIQTKQNKQNWTRLLHSVALGLDLNGELKPLRWRAVAVRRGANQTRR